MIALLVDIGNSRIKWRTARLDNAAALAEVAASPAWMSAEDALPVADIDDVEAAFRTVSTPNGPVDLALVGNVASTAVGRAVERAVTAVWAGASVRFVRPDAVTCGLVNGYRDPLQLGVDRWLAAVAAHVLHPDRSILVCTFGTATTIDLVELDRFVGGLILPGIDTMLTALSTSTARLQARPGQVVDFADRTEDAIASGVMAAQIGAVQRALSKAGARQSGGDARPPLCVVAGGAAGAITPFLGEIDAPHRVVHDLVLRGLLLEGRAATIDPAPTTA